MSAAIRSAAAASGSPRGFTLLELFVVLALLGLVTAIAVPNLERLFGAVTRTTERDHILDQFTGLGRLAMHRGRNYVVFGNGDAGGASTEDPPPEAAEEGGEGRVRDFAASMLSGYEHYAVDVPEGWEIRLDPPLVVRANGVCLGAGLTLYYQGAAEPRIELEPPYCRVAPDA